VVVGSLLSIQLPLGLVIIAQGWCNVSVVALLLDLPVLAVFIEAKLFKFISPLLQGKDITLYGLSNVYTVELPFPAMVVVLGFRTEQRKKLGTFYLLLPRHFNHIIGSLHTPRA
jgi:hypothetical protein